MAAAIALRDPVLDEIDAPCAGCFGHPKGRHVGGECRDCRRAGRWPFHDFVPKPRPRTAAEVHPTNGKLLVRASLDEWNALDLPPLDPAALRRFREIADCTEPDA